jgi:hypothetical protein
MAMHDLALEPWSYNEVSSRVSRRTWGQVISGRTTYTDPCCEELGQTERKIMGFTFWIVALILVHVAFLFMVPWE